MSKCLKELLPGKSKPYLKGLLVNGKIITNSKGIVNAYTEYFTPIGNDLASKLPPYNLSNFTNSNQLSGIPTFHFPIIPTDFVEKQLSHMPENKAVGLDKISSRLFRIAAPIISKPLTSIMNKSLQNGKFMTEWKHAKVIPLHKSGPTIVRNNYRPISIIPILSTVLERFVHRCYCDYLTEFKLFTIAQSGLRKLHSTVTSLVHISDRWLSNIDKGLVTGVVFIDLCKAFDTVNINILLLKLPRYGISGSERKWFESYLTGHTQSVSVDGQLSDPLPVTISVPQGSILGPLLFLLYLNDLPADDTKMDNAKNPEECNELQKSINDGLSCLKTYFDDNRLSVNVDKCEFMLLGTYQTLRKIPSPQIHINNEPLRQVSVVKYLGIYIDENLHWDHHIDTLVKKISSKIGILRSLRNIVPIDTLKLMYNAIVLPTLIMLMLCMMQPLRPINLGYRGCKHDQLD